MAAMPDIGHEGLIMKTLFERCFGADLHTEHPLSMTNHIILLFV